MGKLAVISDNCGGQYKNLNVVLNYLHELHSGHLQYTDIFFFFLVPALNFMSCDRAVGYIEKTISNEGEIYNVDDYCEVTENAVHVKHEVIRMTRDDLLDVQVLQLYVTTRSLIIHTGLSMQDILQFV